MEGIRHISTDRETHRQALKRGGLFAICLFATVGALWASATVPAPSDMRGIGRAALEQLRAIAAAPARAASPYLVQTSDDQRTFVGGAR